MKESQCITNGDLAVQRAMIQEIEAIKNRVQLYSALLKFLVGVICRYFNLACNMLVRKEFYFRDFSYFCRKLLKKSILMRAGHES